MAGPPPLEHPLEHLPPPPLAALCTIVIKMYVCGCVGSSARFILL